MEEGLNDFEAGYANDVAPKEEAAKVEAPEEKVEAVPAEEVKQEEEKPDPIKEIISRFDKLETRTRSVEGHIGGLTSRLKSMNEQMEAAKAAAKTVQDAPTAGQMKEAGESQREWDALKSDFPEWAAATEKLLDSKLGQGKDYEKVLEEKLSQVANHFANKTEQIRYEAGMESLHVAFPDWVSEVNTPEFKQWSETQPDNIKALAASARPADAAKMLRLFHSRKIEAKSDASTVRKNRFRDAITPKGSGASSPAHADIDDFMAGYNSHA